MCSIASLGQSLRWGVILEPPSLVFRFERSLRRSRSKQETAGNGQMYDRVGVFGCFDDFDVQP